MKEFDCVEVIVEKEKYARDGVHKGMQGWICWNESIDASWLVSFPQYGEKPNIATIGIKEEELMIISKMDARVNERIKAQFEDSGNSAKTLSEKPDDLSGYLI
ncbi:MAG: hypothetical protein IJ448_00790 [Oscillospiraceae bacterium]|nr:hypothetical protein [Oscillospiraceae bacterium]